MRTAYAQTNLKELNILSAKHILDLDLKFVIFAYKCIPVHEQEST